MIERSSDPANRDYVTFREFMAFHEKQAEKIEAMLQKHEERMIEVITNSQRNFGHEVERVAGERREEDRRKIEALEREVEVLRGQLPKEKGGGFGVNSLLMGRKSGMGWMISGAVLVITAYLLILQPNIRHIPIIGQLMAR